MRGRSRSGPVKSRRRKPAARKRPGRTEAARSSSSSVADKEPEIARLAHDLHDALERETAASEILNIISSTQAASVQPVLDIVVTNAARLCRALNATIYLREGDVAVIHAQFGEGGSPLDTRRALNADWITGRAILEARTIHVPDLRSAAGLPLASFWQLGGKCILSPNRKSRSCRTSRPRRLSPSRTHGCSMSCGSERLISASHWNSRRRLLTYCA